MNKTWKEFGRWIVSRPLNLAVVAVVLVTLYFTGILKFLVGLAAIVFVLYLVANMLRATPGNKKSK